jgi:tetratricopeptide (TPR) repeat protein
MKLSGARLVLLAVVLATGPLLAGRAQAGNEEDARAYLDKATAAYALNKYAVAAENFEKAFELKPDPALLYNAAQAWRLAGNKERALALYESYLRVYPANDKRATVEARIKDLKQAIEREKTVVNQPPNNTIPIGGGTSATSPPPPPTSPPPPAMPPPTAAQPVQPVNVASATPPPAAPPPTESSSSSNPTMLTQSASPPAQDEPLTKKPLFWVAVGGGVVAATVVVLLLALGGGEDPASASLGRVRGN